MQFLPCVLHFWSPGNCLLLSQAFGLSTQHCQLVSGAVIPRVGLPPQLLTQPSLSFKEAELPILKFGYIDFTVTLIQLLHLKEQDFQPILFGRFL